MLGVGGDVGYGDVNQELKVSTIYKKYCTILRKIKKNVGEGRGGGVIFEPKTLSVYLKKKENKTFHQILLSSSPFS